MDPSHSADSPEEALKRQISEHGEVFLRELARTHARFEERVRELSAVRRVVDALKYIQDARRVFEGIIDTVIDETNAENCSLMLLDRETGGLQVKAARSQTDAESRYYDPQHVQQSRFRRGEGIAGWVAEHGEPVSIPDIAHDTRFVDASQRIGPIGSILCLPLRLDDAVVGVMNLSHPRPKAFTDSDVRLMMLIADQVAIALNSVQLFEDTRQLNTALSREVDRATEALQKANTALQTEIAERKQAEQELVRTQRLRAVGELSVGVSHNLNNILTGIWGPAQLLLRATRDPYLLRQATLINTFAERATDLVARLHTATRVEEEANLQPVRVNDAVREAIETARPRWKDVPESRGVSIQMVTDLPEVPPIQGTASGLYDMLVNLLFNAVDAMPGGGTITVSSRQIVDRVHIVVRDTGIGMDAETLQRIFEPFFTTKSDVGRGLGLATVYGTAVRWGGEVAVESTPGAGTTFTLRFPLRTESEAEQKEASVPGVARRGRVMVVDDEAAIAEILSTLLGDEHDVAVFESGADALADFAPGRFDVVLVDLGMPGMPGDALAEQFRRVDPHVALVLTTGWKLADDDARLAHFDFWMQKPFRGLDRVRDLVGRGIALHDARAESAG